MVRRWGMFLAQACCLALGTLGAVRGPLADLPSGAAPATSDALPVSSWLDAKEAHLTLGWAALDRSDPTSQSAHAAAALHRGPANAYAWVLLAWAHQEGGVPVRARNALQRSWQLAPHSRNLSWMRASLGTRYWANLSAQQRRLLAKDLDRARIRAPRLFEHRTLSDPRFAAVWRLSRRLHLGATPMNRT